jgi:4-aminobutyrate aminotransferase/(S)-3-amino-2-methylpropionate transaminase
MDPSLNTDDFAKEYDQYVVTSYGKPFPGVVIDKAEGIYVTDTKGKEYLDFWAGITVTAIGHRNPRVQEAVRKQMDKVVHCASQSYYSPPVLELAKKLDAISPTKKPCKATFHTCGTEANDVALKMVKRYTKRQEIIALQGCYHSWGYHSGVPGTPSSYYPHAAPAIGPSAPGVYYAPYPYCYRCPLGLEYPGCNIQCAKMVESIINFSTSRDVAGLIAEVIQGVGGIVTPPDEYFQELKKVLDKYDIPLILDEVQTRLGITGKMWGSETYNVEPDVITTAKAVANGWPFGVTLAEKEIADSLEAGDHYSTFGGNPVMCAAAIATIDYIIENRLWENVEKMGALLMKGLKEMESKYEIVGETRGRGLMIGVEIVKDKRTKEPGIEESGHIRRLCADYGLIIGAGGWWKNVIRIQPPMTVRQEHIGQALDILESAIARAESSRDLDGR